MIERLVEGHVAVAETRGDTSAPIPFEAEEEAVARACARRRREFATGRVCARRALIGLGLAPVAIPKGSKGEPIWPPGVVGSITHCRGFRAAAVARSAAIASLGIDAEVNAPLPRGVFERVAHGGERELTGTTGPGRGEPVHLDRLLFSAKESVYKAWFQLCPRWLGFEDVEVAIDPKRGAFHGRFRVPGPHVDGSRLEELHGRWSVERGVLASAVVIPRAQGRSCGDGRPARSPWPGP